MIQSQPKGQSRVVTPTCSAVCCRGEEVYPDAEIDILRNKEYIASLKPKRRYIDPSLIICPRPIHTYNMSASTGGSRSSRDEFPTNSELVIMSYRVLGFILRLRKLGTCIFFKVPEAVTLKLISSCREIEQQLFCPD